jgi:Cellulose binding domain
MLRRLLSAAVTVAAIAGGTAGLPGAAQAATAAPACTGTVAISQFAFSPPSVPAGQTATLSLVLQNCTSQAIQGQTTWFGHFTWPGGGIPPGCPVIDPIAFPYSIAPGASYSTSEQEGDTLQGCQATGLQSTVNVTVNNVTGTAATATASLIITQPTTTGPGCHVTYAAGNWQGGFTASVSITNTGSAPVSGWTLAFTFPGDQKISNAWNAHVTQNGASVTAGNLSYNATIAAGGSQSFGFQGTWAASDASPTSFSLNGTACT